jgi:hypothetical protein
MYDRKASLWALVTSPKGPEKLPHSVPKGKGKFFQENLEQRMILTTIINPLS